MEKEEREKKVIDLYLSGINPTRVSKELDINRRSIYRILNRNGIELHKRTKQINCVICGNETSSIRNRCNSCNTKIRRYRAKKTGINYLGGKCHNCGWCGDTSGFDFHHKEPSEKDFKLTALKMANTKWEIINAELDKCILLCALCHRLEHSNYTSESFLNEVKNYNGKIFKD